MQKEYDRIKWFSLLCIQQILNKMLENNFVVSRNKQLATWSTFFKSMKTQYKVW